MQRPLAPGHESPSIRLRQPGRHEILYIDCDPSLRGDPLRVRWLAETAGGEIDLITARTGERGVQLARSRQPHLIILELGAPSSGGIEVITSLRESAETYLIPIVALSSGRCENLPGLSMYCRRPVPAPEFLAMLRLLLRREPNARRRSASSDGGRGAVPVG